MAGSLVPWKELEEARVGAHRGEVALPRGVLKTLGVPAAILGG